MRAVLIDAYDSFVFILRQYLEEMGMETRVVRNDAVGPADVAALGPDLVVLGPGPGHPADAGYVEMIAALRGRVPMLGVCLGHQAIGLFHGAAVARARAPVHGKTSLVAHDGRGVFAGIDGPFEATRYHSLAVEEEGLPPGLEVSARSLDDGHVMGLRDRAAALEGVQFHPESIRTDHGRRILAGFVRAHVDPLWTPAGRLAA